MSTCVDCKYFNIKGTVVTNVSGTTVTAVMRSDKENNVCFNPKLYEHTNDDGIITGNDHIETGPNFGCIHFEPKTP